MKVLENVILPFLIGILFAFFAPRNCNKPERIKPLTIDTIPVSRYDFSETMYRVYMQGFKDGFFNEQRTQYTIDTMLNEIYRRVRR